MRFKESWKKLRAVSGRDEGFTLVELIVVIAILGILAGIGTVGYSGYIKKAQTAADEILLDSLNTAFAAACIENGEDAAKVAAENITISGGTVSKTDIVVTDPNAKATAIQDAFAKYYEGGEFKVYTALKFEDGIFKGDSDNVYSNLVFDDTDINALLASVFGTKLEMDDLMKKVDFASQLAAGLADSNDKMNALLMSEQNMETLAEYLNTDPDGLDAALTPLVEQRAAMLAAANGGSADDYLAQAQNEVLANNAVLVAATNSGFNTDAFAEMLGNGTAKAEINSNLNDDPQKALSQAALAYAMYTAYAANNDITVSDNLDLADVLNTLDTQEFKDYMNNVDNNGQAEKDLAGYLAAMNMIDSSTEDSTVVSNLLVNGFADENLINVLNSAIKK